MYRVAIEYFSSVPVLEILPTQSESCGCHIVLAHFTRFSPFVYSPPPPSPKFSFFYVLSFILIVTGVFIYNLRQPSTAKKKEEQREGGQTLSEEREGRQVLSRLRRALFESHTYEMSESREKRGLQDSASPPPAPASKPKGLIGRLASKLVSKLPSLPTPADHSALASSSRKKMRTFQDLAEDDKHGSDDGGFFGASKEGLIRDRSSSGSDVVYGSVERTTKPRTSCSPPPRQ